MKRLLFAAALAAAVFALPAQAQIGVSVTLGEPGFYGRVDLGSAPPPRLVYRRPMVIEQGPYSVEDPIYLRVRPGYQRNWRRHCAEYDACGRQVYFVRDDWYENRYVPHYRAHRDEYDRRDEGDRRDYGDQRYNGDPQYNSDQQYRDQQYREQQYRDQQVRDQQILDQQIREQQARDQQYQRDQQYRRDHGDHHDDGDQGDHHDREVNHDDQQH